MAVQRMLRKIDTATPHVAVMRAQFVSNDLELEWRFFVLGNSLPPPIATGNIQRFRRYRTPYGLA